MVLLTQCDFVERQVRVWCVFATCFKHIALRL